MREFGAEISEAMGDKIGEGMGAKLRGKELR